MPPPSHTETPAVGRRAGAVEITPGVGVEAVGGIAGTGAVVGTVEFLDSRDIVHQRAGRIGFDPALTEVLAGIAFTPVAHDAVATGVLAVAGVLVAGVAFAGVVVARVSQAQGVTDLMGQGLTAIVVQVGVLVLGVAAVDQVPRGAVVAGAGTWQVGKCRRAILATAVVAEGHVGVATRGFLGKHDVGHVSPGLHGQDCLGLLLGAELAEPGDAMLIHGARGSRGQEGIGQIDLAVTVQVLIGSAVTQQLRGGLIDRERRFAIDREIAATIVLVAEAIDLVIRRTCCGQRHQLLFGRCNSVLCYFRHKHTSL